jgi:hypothetical protein
MGINDEVGPAEIIMRNNALGKLFKCGTEDEK